MPIKTIYFKEDIYSRLKEEKNMSGIIDRLLRQYYSESPKEEKIMLSPGELQKRKEALAREVEYIKKVESSLLDEEAEGLFLLEKEKARSITRRKIVKEQFKDLMHREMTEEQCDEYLNLFDKDKVLNLVDFIKNFMHEELYIESENAL